jgi:hypothetical protein
VESRNRPDGTVLKRPRFAAPESLVEPNWPGDLDGDFGLMFTGIERHYTDRDF